MPEPGLHGHRIDPSSEPQARRGVPQVVNAANQALADVLLIASWTGLRWSELREVRVRAFVRAPMPVLLVSRAAPEGVAAKVTKVGQESTGAGR